jgi:hypothetical protein
MCIMQFVIFQRLFYYPSILVTVITSVQTPDGKSKFYSEEKQGTINMFKGNRLTLKIS